MLKNRNELTEELRTIVSRLAPFYRFWTTCDGRKNYGYWPSDNHGTVFEKAVENGTNLFDFGNTDLIYPWTHVSSLWVSLCLKAALVGENVNILQVDRAVGGNHHFCEINVAGRIYYFDGLLVTDDYREIFGVGDEPPTLLNMTITKATHAYGDVEGTLMFATWCELNKIDTRQHLDGWEHPLVLVGSRDLDSLTGLLLRREKTKKEFMVVANDGVAVYFPHSNIDITTNPGVLDV